MNVDLNEIKISGTINNVMDNNQDYIKFGLTTLKYDKRKVYSSLNINRNLYEIYKDFFVKGTKVFIKGYLNSYSSNNNIRLFITVLDIADNEDKLINDRISGEKNANDIHYTIGKNIREVIKKNGGTMPKDLPTPEKSLKELEKEKKN